MESSKIKKGNSKTANISENEKVFYHFSPQITKLRRKYLYGIQIFEKIINQDSFT